MSLELLGAMRETCYDMFVARGYTDIEIDRITLTAKTSEGRLVHLQFVQQPKLNVELVKYFYSKLYAQGIFHAILVSEQGATPSVSKLIASIQEFTFELFESRQLVFNPLKHRLVPKHSLEPAQNHPHAQKYPVLSRADAISKFMGFVSGQVIRIDRKDGTIYFRVVKSLQ